MLTLFGVSYINTPTPVPVWPLLVSSNPVACPANSSFAKSSLRVALASSILIGDCLLPPHAVYCSAQRDGPSPATTHTRARTDRCIIIHPSACHASCCQLDACHRHATAISTTVLHRNPGRIVDIDVSPGIFWQKMPITQSAVLTKSIDTSNSSTFSQYN